MNAEQQVDPQKVGEVMTVESWKGCHCRDEVTVEVEAVRTPGRGNNSAHVKGADWEPVNRISKERQNLTLESLAGRQLQVACAELLCRGGSTSHKEHSDEGKPGFYANHQVVSGTRVHGKLM